MKKFRIKKPKTLAIFIISILNAIEVIYAGSLNVSITKPADFKFSDGSGNPFILVNSNSPVSFDCSVNGQGSGSLYYDWSFGSGNPPDNSNGDNSVSNFGPVSFDQNTSAGIDVTEENDNGAPCSTGSSSIPVYVAGFYFDNGSSNIDGSFYVPSGWTLQGGVIPVSSDVTVSIGGSGVDMSSIDATDNHQGNWTLNPGTGTTDNSGNFQTTIWSADSTTLKDQQSSTYVVFTQGSKDFKSENKNIYPAAFVDLFATTLYYCPVESGFTADNDAANMPFSGRKTKQDFLSAVQQEGWGLMAEPINGHYYLGYYSGAYHLADYPENSGGGILIPGYSAAGAPIGFNTTSRNNCIHTYNSSIQSVFNSSDWNIVDVGTAINTPTHVDLYYGIDNPNGGGLRYGTPATPKSTQWSTYMSLTAQ